MDRFLPESILLRVFIISLVAGSVFSLLFGK